MNEGHKTGVSDPRSDPQNGVLCHQVSEKWALSLGIFTTALGYRLFCGKDPIARVNFVEDEERRTRGEARFGALARSSCSTSKKIAPSGYKTGIWTECLKLKSMFGNTFGE